MEQETPSPFHAGEMEMQRRAGVRDKLEALGRRVVRDYMPDQHREFFAQLPLMLLGALDESQQPQATLVYGAPGFLSTPDAHHLRIDAQLSQDDPLKNALRAGADVGLLGIDLHTRRRNRMNGKILRADNDGFAVRVRQSFGNCPQYIQRRIYDFVEDAPGPASTIAALEETTTRLIEKADTFFIASHYDGDGDGDGDGDPQAGGADLSHRGGRNGFVRVVDAHTLLWPEFSGNAHFNTQGNLYMNPRAGLLFVDFESGDLLHLAGRARIIEDRDALSAYPGAQKLIRFEIDEARLRPAALPMRWRFEEWSPTLERIGDWV